VLESTWCGHLAIETHCPKTDEVLLLPAWIQFLPITFLHRMHAADGQDMAAAVLAASSSSGAAACSARAS
jgi:hypothetical protein